MKRFYQLFLVLILVFALIGCESSPIPVKQEEEKLNTELSIDDYFPFKENTIYDYEGIGNEFVERKVFFEYIDGNKAQLKVLNPGTNVIRVLEYADGMLKEVYYEGEFYHIENMLNVSGEQTDIILKEPLTLGNSWTTADGYNRSITGLDVEIETPMDTFKALEVTTEFGEDRTEKRYYVKDLGLVAILYEDGEDKVEVLLRSMESKPMTFNIETYYPSSKDRDILTLLVNRQVDFHTNQSMERLMEDILKNPPSDGLAQVIPDTTTINMLKLDRLDWSVKVDFSEDLLRDMNVGSSFETEILKSIVNTLGRFYDVERVFISVDGKPYESGHYMLEADEFFEVDMDGIEEYQE